MKKKSECEPAIRRLCHDWRTDARAAEMIEAAFARLQ
jgi:hypothetical protein